MEKVQIKDKRSKKLLYEIPYQSISLPNDRIIKLSSTSTVINKRIKRFFVKEPNTLKWIDSFNSDDIFFDVGACIGQYAIYAAIVPNCRSYCFEPHALNYAEIIKNLYINGLSLKVSAYCLALSDTNELSSLYLSRFVAGESHNDFGENRVATQSNTNTQWMESFFENMTEQRLQHGAVGFTLDYLLYEQKSMPIPTQLKIDVDGFEDKIIAGASQLLLDQTLKSVLVEINDKIEPCVEILNTMKTAGWRVSDTYALSESESNYIFIRG